MTITTKYLAACAAVGLTAVLLAGCSTEAASEGKTTTSENTTADKKVETPTPTPSADTNAKFGETVSYKGIDLSVGVPAAFTPSEYASGGTQPSNVIVDITIKNTGTENFDPALINVTASSGGAEATGVYDSDNALNGAPTTTIPAGQTVTWKQGFNVANPADIIMDVNPGVFEFKTATFTS